MIPFVIWIWLIGFVAFSTTTIVEVILWLTWSAAYFRSGILIFRRERPFSQLKDVALDLDQLRESFRSLVFPPLAFRRLTHGEYAFREGFSLKPLSHSSLMHGLIRVDPVRHVLIVEGRMLWFNLVLPVFAAVFFVAAGTRASVIGGFFAILLTLQAVIYGIQAWRFGRVAEIAHDQLRSI